MASGVGSKPSEKIVVIQPLRGWVGLNLRELWAYRELLFYFTWRDIKLRYKQTLLGATWVLLQPIANMILFTIIFGRLANLDSGGIPYPIFSYTALLPWTFFSEGLSRSANSLVGNTNLVKKVYFPRLVIPLSSVIGGLPDFLLSFVILIGMMLYYSLYPVGWALVAVPLLLLLAGITALGFGLWFSAINVMYRDTRYVVGFLLRFWMYATPVAYSSHLIKEPWRTIYTLNPLAGVVEGFRWALLGKGSPPDATILISVAISLAVLLSGAYFFRRMEKRFADLV